MNAKQELLSSLPSVDEVLKSPYGEDWLRTYPRRYVLSAVREVIGLKRKKILEGTAPVTSVEDLAPDIEVSVKRLSSFSLRQVINATGIVIHTNLGRSVLSERVMENVRRVAVGYSNLEYDLESGKRGKRYVHIKRLLREITGAEDGFAVNNNAAAVLLCLSTLAKGREVIVSRGELVEIGGSFRVPDVMGNSGAVLKEVGTTNKTHGYDYESAVSDATALILKVHQSNYRVIGFTEDVPLEMLVAFGHGRDIPVMYDWGSGCLIDLKPHRIYSEPTIQEILRSGVDIVTFSGDKLLGGPQAGLIVGKRELIDRIERNPLTRAVRIDKLTLAALEATLREYLDEEKVRENIPTLGMLLENPASIKARAKKIAALLRRYVTDASIALIEDRSQSGGGSLPEMEFKTYAVSIRPEKISVNRLEEKLRKCEPPIVARIQENALIIDPRTITTEQVPLVVKGVKEALR
ncbi:MAG TPA: L-seryl-tRNA(Sec) selenium transferase [Nitrospiraceae bacterium]|jgi:L-seryl-tRNA(Ser) seleniumtransferase|nr:L-seryl-tRNA(Sec) selenium transferase [Nitrospiraceae bacterium]